MALGSQTNFDPSDRLMPSRWPEAARETPVGLVGDDPPIHYDKGTVLGEVTATPGIYGEYGTSNMDGTGTASAILQYPTDVDANGNCTIPGEFGATAPSVPAYVGGYFFSDEISGLDSDALTDLKGRYINPNGTSPEFHF